MRGRRVPQVSGREAMGSESGLVLADQGSRRLVGEDERRLVSGGWGRVGVVWPCEENVHVFVTCQF